MADTTDMADTIEDDVRRLKVTVVGDGNVGKTCLLYVFKNGSFPASDEYVPTIFENTSIEMDYEEEQIQLNLWDTAGQEAYERLRLLIYPRTDVFLLCYAVNSANSFGNISVKWLPELKEHCPTATIILVATKTDTRSRAAQALDSAHGWRLCKAHKLDGFQECSSKTGQGVREVFTTAVSVALQGQKQKPSCWQTRCVLL